MWKPFLTSLTLYLLTACSSALPQSPTPTSTPTPTPTPIPWPDKIDALRAYILTQRDHPPTAGFWSGPIYTLRFPDGDCHQIRLYNWCCTWDIPYKMSELAAWMDRSGLRNHNWTGWADPKITGMGRYDYYRNPEDGWGFYDVARMMYSSCGARGPQSACGHVLCVDRNGTVPKVIPEGQSLYVDPNNRNQVCPWLREEGTGTV